MFILISIFVSLLINLVNCVNMKDIVQKKEQKTLTPSIVLKLDADQIVDTLRTVMNSQFIQTMANDIASKAVKNFVKEMKLKEKQKLQSMQALQGMQGPIVNERHVPPNPVPVPQNPVHNVKQEASYHPQAESVPDQAPADHNLDQRVRLDMKEEDDDKKKNPTGLDEQIAYALLRDPSPDGDNLGLDSLEPPVTVKSMPKKINGIYMRRHREPVMLRVDSSEEAPVQYRRTLQ